MAPAGRRGLGAREPAYGIRNEAGMCPGINCLTNYAPIADGGEERRRSQIRKGRLVGVPAERLYYGCCPLTPFCAPQGRGGTAKRWARARLRATGEN